MHQRKRGGFFEDRFKKSIGVTIASFLLILNFTPHVQSLRNLPQIMRMTTGQQQDISFLFPLQTHVEQEDSVVNLSSDERLHNKTTIRGNEEGSANVTFSLLGLPLKQVTVKVEEQRRLIPGGQAVGIAMYTDGVFVVDCADVYLADGSHRNPAKEAGLQSGDSIVRIGNEAVRSMQQLTAAVKNASSSTLKLTYKRNGKTFESRISPVIDEEGEKRLGLWVRDSTAGIGTMTYFDPVENRFGALGHAITDIDTYKILSVRDGDVFSSRIVDVKKGTRGEPGELHGIFQNGMNKICSIDKNTEYGVYGLQGANLANPLYPEGLPVGSQSMVHTGSASILTTVDEDGVKEFSCEIVRATPQLAPAQRSMIIQITDPELLAKTGGIVQGMSGSPIIQDGHIIGAVTHVYVNDPTKGYGLYIDWMLDAQ